MKNYWGLNDFNGEKKTPYMTTLILIKQNIQTFVRSSYLEKMNPDSGIKPEQSKNFFGVCGPLC